MQGLGALEFVLFGTDSQALAEPGDPYRCAYGAAIAGNVEEMAALILAGVAGSGGHFAAMGRSGPAEPALPD